MSQAGSTPAGWYPDSVPNQWRWWDGSAWTEHIAPMSPEPPGQPSMEVQPSPAAVQSVVEIGTPTPSNGVQPAQVQPALPPNPTSDHRRSLFGGKKELEAEVDRLQAELAALGAPERDALQAQLTKLRAEVPQLSDERDRVMEELDPLRAELATRRSEVESARALLAQVTDLQTTKAALETSIGKLRSTLNERDHLKAELKALKGEIVETRETEILQEVGIYEYRHPLEDAPAYKAKLAGISARIKDAAKAGRAVVGSTTWTVNGSAAQGRKMVTEFSKLMLRAYNNEADNAVRSMKPYALDSAIARLTKARETISKLGTTMSIRVEDRYHKLRIEELELTADYLAKVAEEKERDREIRARAREDELARREIEREQARLAKEQEHHRLAMEALRAQGDDTAADELEAKVAEVQDAIDGLTRRAANTRAGSVYIISNIGAFGPDMVKIGMTRRLDPMDRVRELGDASVPFRYDVHAIVPSDDAVGLETRLHHELAHAKVNLVNTRREFFRVHPDEVRDLLLEFGESILHWQEEPEALEWRQSERERLASAGGS